MVCERKKGKEYEPDPPPGFVEVIAGCMFSGKSDELIRRVRRAPFAQKEVKVFKPATDKRRGEDTINTFDGTEIPAIAVNSSMEILDHVDEETDWIAIDEAQFMDENLLFVVRKLASRGKRVIVAGLDKDFRGNVFGPMGDLLVEADSVKKLHARCNECGNKAGMTQRLKKENDKWIPAHYDDEIVLVGEEEYRARCRNCHEVPGKPDAKLE